MSCENWVLKLFFLEPFNVDVNICNYVCVNKINEAHKKNL